MSDPAPVVHNAAASRFEVTVEGHLAVAEYALAGGRMIFTHTFVPPELRGRDLAARLVSTALDWARAHGHRVVPQCSYVARYIERNKQYADLLASS